MANVKLYNADYVRFYLKSEIAPRLRLDKEPSGWSDDGLEFVRHEKYHGILTSFTGDLSFFKEARQYILDDKEELGINSQLKLQKYELQEVDGDIRFVLEYSGIVDYTTFTDKDEELKIKFNSNELEELIKTREDDEFDLEREFSIDEKSIDLLQTNKVDIDGVGLIESTSMNLIKDSNFIDGDFAADPKDSDYAQGRTTYQQIYFRGGPGIITPPLDLVTNGENRISSPDTSIFNADPAAKMFFVDSATLDPDDDTAVSIDLRFEIEADVKVVSYKGSDSRHSRPCSIVLVRYRRNPLTLDYEIVNQRVLDTTIVNRSNYKRLSASGQIKIENILPSEGLVIGFLGTYREYYLSSIPIKYDARVYKTNLNINLVQLKERTINHDFLFIDKCFERLIQIITGEKNRFLSRIFGRKENGYLEDGIYSDIGLISGYWVRKFTKDYDLYKSMKMSLKDLIESTMAVFNIGIGIEVIDGKQKIVVEDLKFFYQNSVGIKLPKQVSEVKVKTIKNDYFSSLELGYEKGGDYSDTLGVDEPNIKTNRITPIFRNKQDFKKVSKVRADDIGLEQIRRKPASLYGDEDTQQDEHIWFLDLKKDESSVTNNWIQKTWEDRLLYKPDNLSYADTFKSFFFTPLRILFRHGWVIRAGLNQKINLTKKISLSNSDSNSKLFMWFKEDERGYSENENIFIKNLEVPRTEPESIEFTHPVNDDILKQILGKTKISYNGELIMVPNYYFRIQWIDENNNKQYGYILSIKPKENKFEVIKANNKIII